MLTLIICSICVVSHLQYIDLDIPEVIVFGLLLLIIVLLIHLLVYVVHQLQVHLHTTLLFQAN